VGKFTEEEFDIAYTNFEKNNHPKYIFTYFKDVPTSTSQVNLDDLISLRKFQELVASVGHFYTSYNDTNDLLRQLKNQLEKIYDEMALF